MKIILLSAIMLILSSCGNNRYNQSILDDDNETILVISYSQVSENMLYPEYTLELYSNRQMHLKSVKNLDKEGKYMRLLTDMEFQQIINVFTESKLFLLNDKYLGEGDNLIVRTIYFTNGKDKKTIKYQNNYPQKLNELELLLQSFLDRVGWNKMSW